MAIAASIQARIVKNGGPVTKDVYKAYYSAGTSATEDWAKGELLFLDATGYICRSDHTIGAGTFGTAAQVSTNTTTDPFGTALKRFVALEDHDSSAEGKSVYVAVQEILDDTVLEMQVCASSTTAPTQANILPGLAYAAYLSTTGVWGLDVEAPGAYGIFVVQDKDSDVKWMKADPGVANTTPGNFVRVKVLKSMLA